MAETCCLLLDILLTFLPHGVLMMLQISSTFLLVRTYSLPRMCWPCSLMSNWAMSRLNLSHKYISWSHEAITSDLRSSFCMYATDSILHLTVHHPLSESPLASSSIFAKSALECSSSSSRVTGLSLGSAPSGS